MAASLIFNLQFTMYVSSSCGAVKGVVRNTWTILYVAAIFRYQRNDAVEDEGN